MGRAWLCGCGQLFPETGNASGWGRWRRHQRDKDKSPDGAKCRKIGLIDDATGEILVSGEQGAIQALRDAERRGYVDPQRPGVRPQPSGMPVVGAPVVSDAGNGASSSLPSPIERALAAASRPSVPAPGGSPTNLEAIIPYQRIALHPRVYMQKAILDDWIKKENGAAYGWDSRDVSEWVNGMIDLAFVVVLRRRLAESGSPDVSRLLQTGLLQRLVGAARSMSPQEIRSVLHDQGLHEAARMVMVEDTPSGPEEDEDDALEEDDTDASANDTGAADAQDG